ncbi:MAG: methyltransferase type 11 [Gammaproteobacteria bacterium]|nr:methyltransferase type 11 [Gammaproteobacteria bacterium]MDH5617241.1 methyltransferase type 11 [Gammaproteobacteria bacterium]
MDKATTILLALILGACGQHADEAASTPAGAASMAPGTQDLAIYAAAVASKARPSADRERDAGRKPAAVLAFIGIEPGMTVLDMFSGGGYYTEILSHLVGQDGHVIAHNNEAYLQFVGDEFERRYLGGRLGNAQVLLAENNELTLEPDSLDAIMLVLSFHDFFYAAPDNGWPEIDVDRILAEFRHGLKDGGVVGIIDHAAAAGSPGSTGGTTHRIDPAIVISSMTDAGFALAGQSDLLHNPDDDYEKNVFDAELRGKTDRFVLRFVKAE